MGLEGRERDLLGARDADRLGGGLRQVDHPTMGVRAAVVDPHHHRLARLLVRDPDLGTKGQGLVRGGQIVGVEPLPVSRLLAVKAGAVLGPVDNYREAMMAAARWMLARRLVSVLS